MKACPKDIQIPLGQEAYGDNTLFRQHSSPGVDTGNGWTVIKCLNSAKFLRLAAFETMKRQMATAG